MTEEAGGSEKRFLKNFGNVVRWNGPFGVSSAFIGHTPASYSELLTEIVGVCVQEDCLWVADPKALNHILHKSGYSYAKPGNINEVMALLGDRGVASVDGELSITVRRFLLPAHPITNRRRTQASQEGDGSGVWSCRG